MRPARTDQGTGLAEDTAPRARQEMLDAGPPPERNPWKTINKASMEKERTSRSPANVRPVLANGESDGRPPAEILRFWRKFGRKVHFFPENPVPLCIL